MGMLTKLSVAFLLGFLLCFLLMIHITVDPLRGSYGRYQTATKAVILNPSTIYEVGDLYDYKFTALHELGHFYWFKLNKTDRKEYESLFDTHEPLFSEYSKTNVEECFAEYFAKILIGGHPYNNSDTMDRETLKIINEFGII